MTSNQYRGEQLRDLPFWLTVSYVTLSTILIVIAIVSERSEEVTIVAVLTWLTCLVAISGAWVPFKAPPYAPIYWLCLAIFIAGPGRLWYLATYDRIWQQEWYLVGRVIGDFVVGAGITLIGVTVLVGSYALSYFAIYRSSHQGLTGGHGSRTERRLLMTRLRALSGLVLITSGGLIGWFIQLTGGWEAGSIKRAAILEGGGTVVLGPLRALIGAAGVVALVQYAYIVHQSRGSWIDKALSLAIVALYSVWLVVTSERSGLITFWLLLLTVHVIAGGRLKVGRAFLIVACGMAMFVVMSGWRAESRGAVEHWTSTTDTMSTLETLARPIFGAFNLGGFAANTWVYENVPDPMGFRSGATVLEMFWVFVPRQVWRDKPLPLGKEWLSTFRGEYRVANTGGGAATGLIGEGYLNGGVPGVIAFCAMYGLALSLLTRMAVKARMGFGEPAVYYVVLLLPLTHTLYGRYVAAGTTEAVLAAALAFIAMRIVTVSSARAPEAQFVTRRGRMSSQ